MEGFDGTFLDSNFTFNNKCSQIDNTSNNQIKICPKEIFSSSNSPHSSENGYNSGKSDLNLSNIDSPIMEFQIKKSLNYLGKEFSIKLIPINDSSRNSEKYLKRKYVCQSNDNNNTKTKTKAMRIPQDNISDDSINNSNVHFPYVSLPAKSLDLIIKNNTPSFIPLNNSPSKISVYERKKLICQKNIDKAFEDNLKINLNNSNSNTNIYIPENRNIKKVKTSNQENCIFKYKSKMQEKKKRFINENYNISNEIELINENCKIHSIPAFKSDQRNNKI